MTTWEPLDHSGAQDIVSKIFDSDGGEDVKQWLGESGEVRSRITFCFRSMADQPLLCSLSQPIMPQVFTSQHPAMSIHESWQVRFIFLFSLKGRADLVACTAQQEARRVPSTFPQDLVSYS